MAYDEALAERLRETLSSHEGLTEKKMFGGIAFLLHGKMCVGVVNDDLMVRVGPDRYKEALAAQLAREMGFTGKPLTGFVYVSPEGYQTEEGLEAWVSQALDFVRTLREEWAHSHGSSPRGASSGGSQPIVVSPNTCRPGRDVAPLGQLQNELLLRLGA